MALRTSPDLKQLLATYMGQLFGDSFSETGGSLKVYDGSPPGTGGDGTSGCNLIVEFDELLWDTGAGGTAGLSGTFSATAGTSGTAAWARLTSLASSALHIDGECGTASTTAFVISKDVINGGDVVNLTTITFTGPSET